MSRERKKEEKLREEEERGSTLLSLVNED